jgi:hypothetical protein
MKYEPHYVHMCNVDLAHKVYSCNFELKAPNYTKDQLLICEKSKSTSWVRLYALYNFSVSRIRGTE